MHRILLLLGVVFALGWINRTSADKPPVRAKVYDIFGRCVGTVPVRSIVKTVEARPLRSTFITTVEGMTSKIPAGMYFLAPMDFTQPIPFDRTGVFSFRDITDSTLPLQMWNSSGIGVADVNGDSLEDVVFSISPFTCDSSIDSRPRVWIQQPTGKFIDETETRISRGRYAAFQVILFDCEGDGDPDIFLTGWGCGQEYPTATLLVNDGVGVFTDESADRLPSLDRNRYPQTYYSWATVNRFDNNASLDLAVIAFGNGFNPQDPDRLMSLPELWLNDGLGHFVRDTSGRLPIGKYGYFSLESADVHGGVLGDLLFGNMITSVTNPDDPEVVDTLSGQTAYYRNTGDGRFVDETLISIPPGSDRATRLLSVGDADSDNDVDVLEVGLWPGFEPANHPQCRLFLNDGMGRFTTDTTGILDTLTGWFNDAKFARLNGDALEELFFVKVLPGTPGHDVLLVNDGGGSFHDSSSLLPSLTDFSTLCAVFDYQHDGDLDIVVSNTGSGSIGQTTGQNVLYQNLLNDVLNVQPISPRNPDRFTLYQNYPNPFNPWTTISYSLPKAGDVLLEVFDVLGRRLQTLVAAREEAGSHSVRWTTQSICSGLYWYQLSFEGKMIERKKALLLR